MTDRLVDFPDFGYLIDNSSVVFAAGSCFEGYRWKIDVVGENKRHKFILPDVEHRRVGPSEMLEIFGTKIVRTGCKEEFVHGYHI